LAKIELLSPAGDPEKLRVALSFGADAVYGGVSHFSLRIRSGREFSLESFKDGVDYAHALGKKVYATINGFPFNSQLKLVENHLASMRDASVDAFIISTPGMIKLAKKVAPNMPLHLSTQANVLNSLDAEFFYDMGVTRIIAAREVSLKDLEEIKSTVPNLELELFVHGSMCFAYSGRCLISALQSGRVPNRGSCANDCRTPYILYAQNPDTGTLLRLEEVPDEGTYIFNAKDLCMINHLPELINSGVIDSFKIEGRTKSLYYAGIATRAYRLAIDDYMSNKFDISKYEAEIATLKNRGLTDAYIISRPYEKNETQNLETAISGGNYEVAGFINEDGLSFMCKYKIYPNEDVDIVLPIDSHATPMENDIGKIFIKDNDSYAIVFKKILTVSGIELSSVHSGNTNPIMLPASLPAYSFLRKKVED